MNKIMILFLLILFSCSSTPTNKNSNKSKAQQLVYTIDNIGVFSYNINTNKSTQLAKISKEFLHETFQQLNDSLILIGYRTKMAHDTIKRYISYKDSENNISTLDEHVRFTDSIFAVNIRNNTYFTIATVEYLYISNSDLEKKINGLTPKGKPLVQMHETISKNSVYLFDGKLFINMDWEKLMERYFESKVVNGEKIISYHGSLFLSNGRSCKALRTYEHFSPKARNDGYYAPDFSADGSKYLYHFYSFFNLGASGIYESSITGKSNKKILDSEYTNATYSPDADYIASCKYPDSKTNRISDIYITNTTSKTTQKVGQGNSFMWIH